MRSDADAHAQRAKAALAIGVLTALVATWSSWEQLQLIQQVGRGADVSDATLTANDDRQALIGLLQVLIGLVVAIVFLLWVRAVSRRLPELGVTDLKYAPKWAVWGFIVPFINLVRPHQVMSELWRASEIGAGSDDPWRAKATPAIVHLWWGALLIEGVVGRLLLQNMSAETIEGITGYATTTVVADALGIVSAVLAYRLVTEIDARLRASEAQAAERPMPAAIPAI